MSRTLRGPVAAIAAMIGIALIVVVSVVVYRVHSLKAQATRWIPPSDSSGEPAAATRPSDSPITTRPASIKDASKPADATYMDIVRAAYPAFPTTQPLAVPLTLSQAARIVLKDPVYLSAVRGDLWITRSDAPPMDRVLHEAINPNAADPQSHIVPRRVVYVHSMPADSGSWPPYLVCPTADGGYEVVWEHGKAPLPAKRDFQWERAFSWDDAVVVPSRSGMSILHFGPTVTESYRELVTDISREAKPLARSGPQALLDGQGLLAWAPWENGRSGSHGAARYVEGKWSDLGPQQGWPERIAYLVPLRDGTVFQFIEDNQSAITIQNTALSAPAVDEAAIGKLVIQLGDIDQEVRHKALTDLANFGPGAWPTLQKLRDSQPPQAKLLIGQLLKDKDRPTLSGMTLLGKRHLTLVSRLSDGGVVLFAPQGISVPEAEDQSTTIAPAWISVRPGHYMELLSPAMVHDLKPDACQLEVIADQWIVNHDVNGPQLFYGNGMATLLRKDELEFSRIIGMDQMGRWLFRHGDDLNATGPTLIIDPHLPDPTPRLPVWQLAIAETVGWDNHDWPAIKNGAIYALGESDWQPVEKEQSFHTRADEVRSTTFPSTGPATTPADLNPILKARDGTEFFDGLTELRTIGPQGKQLNWPLPDIANGSGPVNLIEATDGRLFLFNQPGRVLRIARTHQPAEPFKIEATFTHNIPSTAKPTRIWLDPAGRIDIAWGARLAILFPAGYIPAPIMQKITDRSGLDADGL